MLNTPLDEMMALGCDGALATVSHLLGGEPLARGLAVRTETPGTSPWDWRDMTRSGWVVSVGVHGTVTGYWLMVFDDAVAQRVAARLTRNGRDPTGEFGRSALLELANIAACAFWGDISRTTRGTFMPSVPQVYRGRLAASMREVATSLQQPVALAAPFGGPGAQFEGTFVLLLEQQSVHALGPLHGRDS